jgi:hypothetical protein
MPEDVEFWNGGRFRKLGGSAWLSQREQSGTQNRLEGRHSPSLIELARETKQQRVRVIRFHHVEVTHSLRRVRFPWQIEVVRE